MSTTQTESFEFHVDRMCVRSMCRSCAVVALVFTVSRCVRRRMPFINSGNIRNVNVRDILELQNVCRVRSSCTVVCAVSDPMCRHS